MHKDYHPSVMAQSGATHKAVSPQATPSYQGVQLPNSSDPQYVTENNAEFKSEPSEPEYSTDSTEMFTGG